MAEMPEERMDLLMNIEVAILDVWKEIPALTDYDVLDALDAVRRHYDAIAVGREPRVLPLHERAKAVSDQIWGTTQIMSGAVAEREDGREFAIPEEGRATPQEIVAAIKRIRKSVERWNKDGGRRGYLSFIRQHVPH